jgi:hypothetical protein
LPLIIPRFPIWKEAIAIAVVQVTRSDLTGTQGEDHEFGRLVIRNYPGVDGARQLDVLPAEVKDLQSISDYVEVEYLPPGGGEPQRMVVTVAELDKLAPDMPAKLAAARSSRGRPRSS